MSESDHDHSGDRLGEEAPVESIDVNEVSIRDFAVPSSYIVYENDGAWHGFRTATQDVVFVDEDGVRVINSVLERIADRGAGRADGLIRVTAGAGGTELASDTTIEHTVDGAGLVFEPGVTFRYTGQGHAVLLAGDGVYFEFDSIVAPEADYGIVDIGLRNAFVDGNEVRGPSKALWLTDAEARLEDVSIDPSGTWVHLPRLDCTDGTDHGIVLTSAPDTRIEGYVWEVTVIGPRDTGIKIGDDSNADSVQNHVFYAGVKGAINNADALVEINDSRNGLYLERYTPATGGEWDIVVGDGVEDGMVFPLTGRDDIRIKREALTYADFGKFDPFRHETMELDIDPDSLDGYEVIEVDTGDVDLDHERVVHSTGPEANSQANLRKRMNFNFGQLQFENQAVLRTDVQVAENDGQRAWLLWGAREGPCVGWRIVDDVLQGFVHRGRGQPGTVELDTGFEPGTSWTLTAFYNPPTSVHYYVDGELAGTISKHLPEGVVNAHWIATVDLVTTEAADKSISWSTWRNHQYPRSATAGKVSADETSGFAASGTREVESASVESGESVGMRLAVEPTGDAVVRDVVPAGWTVHADDNPDVDRVEETSDGTILVYFTPDAPADEQTSYTYDVVAPDDLLDTTSFDFGPFEVRPVDGDTWLAVSDTDVTVLVEAI